MAAVRSFAFFAAVSLVLLVVYLPSAWSSPVPVDGDDVGKTVEHGKLGAVASESSICSRHGSEMLSNGGNAADAVSGIDGVLFRATWRLMDF